jgi:hypothetical protein
VATIGTTDPIQIDRRLRKTAERQGYRLLWRGRAKNAVACYRLLDDLDDIVVGHDAGATAAEIAAYLAEHKSDRPVGRQQTKGR